MKISHLFLLHVIVLLSFAAGLLFAPKFIGEFFQISNFLGSEAELYLSRFVGVTYLALATAAWLMRNEGSSKARFAFLVGLAVLNAGVSLNMGFAVLTGITGAGGWGGVGLGVVLLGGCLYFLSKEEDN